MANSADRIQALMDEEYSEWRKEENKGKGKWDFLEGFSAAHQIAVAFGNFNYQVENGDIEQWIYNGYFHDDAEKFIGFLETGAEIDERCRVILDRVYMNHNINHGFTGAEVIQGDLLTILPTFSDGLFGGIICDPPYASGASDQNAKQKSTAQKYSSAKTNNPLPDFEGDAKDQRSWTHWMTEWLTEARRVSKPGAPICMFIDWRQLPSMTDALQ